MLGKPAQNQLFFNCVLKEQNGVKIGLCIKLKILFNKFTKLSSFANSRDLSQQLSSCFMFFNRKSNTS